MPRYTDELDRVIAYEAALLGRIARRVALEAGAPIVGDPTEDHMAAAVAAIEQWRRDGEQAQDMRAFRPIGPLQELLAEHAAVLDRIDDMRDMRLS